MQRIRLAQIAHARSGDKGDDSNVGIIADTDAAYEILLDELTEERVARHFAHICKGGVTRHEVPNLRAINFILHDSLGGGGTASLKTDAQGKTHGQALLLMELDVPDDLPVRPVEEVFADAIPVPVVAGPSPKTEVDSLEVIDRAGVMVRGEV